LQLALAVLISDVPRLHDWFCEQIKADPKNINKYGRIELAKIIELVRPLKPLQVEYLMAEISVKTAFDGGGRNYGIIFDDQARAAIAEFLGVDFKKWIPTYEWFQKKIRAELVRYIVHESGMATEPEFLDYIGNYKLSLEKVAGLKKADLLQVINEAGTGYTKIEIRFLFHRPHGGHSPVSGRASQAIGA